MGQDVATPRSPRHRPINVNDPYEIQHWARAFGVSDIDVAIAVQVAGPMPEDVAFALSQVTPGTPPARVADSGS